LNLRLSRENQLWNILKKLGKMSVLNKWQIFPSEFVAVDPPPLPMVFRSKIDLKVDEIWCF